MYMAEFKTTTKSGRLMMRHKSMKPLETDYYQRKLSSAIKKKFGISDFRMTTGTFARKPARIFTGKKKGFTIKISRAMGIPGFYGSVKKRGKGEALLMTTNLKEALAASDSIIKEAKKRGRVLRTA
jgi:hypothetical protein